MPPLQTLQLDTYLPRIQTQLQDQIDAVEARPRDAEQAAQLGKMLLAYQQNPAAEVSLRRARLLGLDNFDALYLHAEALKRLGRLDEAGETLREALGYDPEHSFARTRLALILVKTGELEAARELLTSVVADSPRLAIARLHLARVLLHFDASAEALEHLGIVLRQAGPTDDVYFSMADAWRRQGDSDKAGEHFSLFEKYRGVGLPDADPLFREVRALDLSEKPLLRQARRLNKLGQTDRALEVLQAAVERNPANPSAHASLVRAYGALRQFDKVDEHYRLAVEAGPVTAALLRNLARARYYEGRFAEARMAFVDALSRDPKDAATLAWLGIVADAQGNADESERRFKAALRLEPGNAIACFYFGKLLHGQARYAEAQPLLEMLTTPEGALTAKVLTMQAQTLIAQGAHDEARSLLESAVETAIRLESQVDVDQAQTLLRELPE